jgi:hypothetical protein
MTDAVDSRPSVARDERWLWLLFAGAWLVHFALSLVGWDNTLSHSSAGPARRSAI